MEVEQAANPLPPQKEKKKKEKKEKKEKKPQREPISDNQITCMKCQKRVDVQDASTTTIHISKVTSTGKTVESDKELLKGVCPNCGKRMSRFIKTSTIQKSASDVDPSSNENQ